MVLVLPFAMKLQEDGQEVGISDSLEIGLVLSLVESKREKGGGFLRKKDAENISYVSKLYWPLYLIKRSDRKRHVVFDMLGIFDQIFEYETLPEISRLVNELQSNTPSHVQSEEYIALVKSYENSLKDFAGSVQTTLAGCFAHEDLLKDLMDYFYSADEVPEIEDVPTIPSHLSVEQLEKNMDSILELKKKSSEDIESLHRVEDTVFSISSTWNSYLTREQSETIAYFNMKIEEIRPEVESAVAEYRSRMNSEIQSVELRFSPLISNLQAEVARWKREEDMYKRLGETHARQRDSARKARKESESQLNRTEREYQNEIENSRKHYLNLIESELDRIRSLEKRRDGTVKELQKKKDEIKKRTEKVKNRIEKLIQRKNGFIGAIDEVGFELSEDDTLSDNEKSFLCLPIYVAQFQSDSKTRYLVYPPMIIHEEKKAADKLKGFFGGVTLPLEPRTKRFDKIFKNKIEKSITEDTALQREISGKCVQCNILVQSGTKEKYMKALQELKESGWIKDKHYNELSSAFEEYFAS
jgi:hypothetical protein